MEEVETGGIQESEKENAIGGRIHDENIRANKCKYATQKTYRMCIGSIRKILKEECQLVMKDRVDNLLHEFKKETTKAAEEEIDLLFEQEQMVNLFSELDALYLDQLKKYGPDPVWRPSQSAEDNVAAHLYSILENHQTYLSNLLKQKNRENDLLQKNIMSGRKQIEILRDGISQLNADIKKKFASS